MIETILITQEIQGDVFSQLYNKFDFLNQDGELLSEEHRSLILDNNHVYLFVAMKEKEVIGYSLTYKFPSLYSNDFKAYLFDIEVLPDFRQMGIGRTLMNAILTKAKEDGIEELWLGTGINNDAANALYLTTGGTLSEETFNEYTYDFS